MPKKTKSDKKYNLTIVPLWATSREGSYMSIEIGPEHFDNLAKVEVGGKLVFRVLPEEFRKTDKSPNAYLEYISKDDVAAFKARSDSGRKNNEAEL